MTGGSFHLICKECWNQQAMSTTAVGKGRRCSYHPFAITDLKSGVWQSRAMSLFTHIQMGNLKYTAGYTFQTGNCKQVIQDQLIIGQ